MPNEKRRDANKLYNPATIGELQKKYKSIPWKDYINKLLPSNVRVDDDELVIVNVPSFLDSFEKLMANTSKKAQANYAMWRVASGSVRFLNEEIRRRQLKYSTVVSGRTEREARWKECVSLVTGSLPISVGAMYVRKYFQEDAKKDAEDMVKDIKEEFMKILEKV